MAFVTRMAHAVLTWALSAAVLGAFAAGAAAGEPTPWQVGFQPPASPTAERLDAFNDLLLVIIISVVIFVMALLLYVIWRFSEKRNPTPSKTTHNTFIEVLWTAVPVIILIIVAIPSFKLLYFADRIEDAEMTVKAIGRQWYWSYEYPDHGNFTFDAFMVPDEELQPGQRRLLDTDLAVVLPVDTDIRLLITASDVLHAFAVPAFGIKLDAVPGQLNETWVRITRPGTYYGQCSEICGTGHSYMPIKVEAVSKADFESWVEQAKEEFARADDPVRAVRLVEAAGAAPASAD